MYRPFFNSASNTIASSSEQRAVSQAHPFASRNLHPPPASATAKLDGEQEQPRSPAPVRGKGYSLRTLSLLPGDVPHPPSTPHNRLTRDNNSQLVSPKGSWNQQNVTVDQPQHALPFSPALLHEVLPAARTGPVEFGVSDDPTRNAESLAAEAASGTGERAAMKGKTLVLPGIAHPEAIRSMHSLDRLGATLSSELPFRKFRLRLQGHTLQLEGKINPWIKLATGEISNNPKNMPPAGNGWTWTYNRQKLYAVSTLQGTQGDTLILPVKGLFSPYNANPQYGAGLPSLAGGTMEKKHQTHTATLRSEIDEELLRQYDLVGNPQALIKQGAKAPEPFSATVPGNKFSTDYRVYTAEVQKLANPKQIPPLNNDDQGKYYETHATFEFKISTSGLTKASTDDEIRNAVMQEAQNQEAIPTGPLQSVQARFPDQLPNMQTTLTQQQSTTARNEFEGATPTAGLIHYIRSKLPAPPQAPPAVLPQQQQPLPLLQVPPVVPPQQQQPPVVIPQQQPPPIAIPPGAQGQQPPEDEHPKKKARK